MIIEETILNSKKYIKVKGYIEKLMIEYPAYFEGWDIEDYEELCKLINYTE